MNNTVSNTSLSQPASTDIYYGFAFFGLLAVCINIFIMAVLLSDKKLLSHSAVVAGVTLSHCLCGLAIGTTGIFRLTHTDLSAQFHAWECVKLIFPIFYPLAFQSMTSMLILVGLERALAVLAGNWFRNNWTTKRSWILVADAYGYVCVPVIYNMYNAWNNPIPTNLQCTLPSVFGYVSVNWNFFATVLAGLTAVSLTITSYRVGTKLISKLPLLSGELGRMKKQLRLTRAMLTVSCLDFTLVVVPNTLAFISGTWGVYLGGITVLHTNVFYCLNACLVVCCHLTFNSEFRKAAAVLVRWDKCCGISGNVSPHHATTPVQHINLAPT